MEKRKKITAIVTVVLLICLMSSMALAGTTRYTDIASDHWAYQSIYKMSAQNIIAGYEDNTVRPDNNVTQFEAICFAVRIMGLEDKTAEVKSGEYLPFAIPQWEGAYEAAVVAYNADLIDAEDFSYNSPATRQWIAKLLVKILDKESQVNTTTAKLPYTDADQIGSKYLNYVKVANEAGMLGGYEDNTFRPTNNVKRSEMAAFLERAQGSIGIVADNVIAGEIIALNGVSITVSDGTQSKVVYAVDNSRLFNLNKAIIKAADLKVGDYVLAVYDGSLLSYLEICEKDSVNIGQVPQASATIEGEISYFDTNRTTMVVTDSDKKLNTIVITPDTKIYKGSSSVAGIVTDLYLNAKVTVSVDDKQQALSIVIATDSGEIKSGSIYLVDVYKNIIIMREDDELVTYNMDSSIKVSVSGMLTATTSSLKAGDMAQYTASGNNMTAIAVSGTVDENGNITDADTSGKATIISVDKDNKVINYLDVNGNLNAKYYNSSTVFTFGTDTGSAEDLISAESVNITGSGNIITKVVTEREINDFTSGTLYSLDTTNRIIFIKSKGVLCDYAIAKDATIKLNGSKSYLSALKQDMEVALTIEDDEVTKIEADSKIYGTVSAVDKTDKEVTVTLASGKEETYTATTNVTVNKQNSGYETLTALKVGDKVAMVKSSNNKISSIDVIVEVEYTVIKPHSKTSSLVVVKDKDGDQETISLDNSVDLLIPGNNNPVAGDLKEGDILVVTYQGYNITQAEATATYSGTISAVNYTTGAITLKAYDGTTKYFTFNTNSTLTKNSYTYTSLSSNNLSVRDRVAITQLGDGEINIAALSERTSKVGIVSSQYIFLVNSSVAGDWSSYEIADNCYTHTASSTTSINVTSIAPDDTVSIYYAGNMVYEIVKK